MDVVFKNETVDSHVYNMYNVIKSVENVYNNYKLVDYINIVIDYIKNNNTKITLEDVEYILEFIIFEYIPKTYDFPLNKYINNERIGNLIEKTATLNENNPNKWTNKRLRSLNSTMDEYIKTIYYDNEFYSWYLYSIVDQQNRDIKSITNVCVLIRFLMIFLIKLNKEIYVTTYIIFKNSANLIKIKEVFNILKRIYEKNSIYKIESLFIQNQLENTYQIVDDKLYTELIKNKKAFEILELVKNTNTVNQIQLF